MKKTAFFTLSFCLLLLQNIFAQFDYPALKLSAPAPKPGSKVEFTIDLTSETKEFIEQAKFVAYVMGEEEEFSEADAVFDFQNGLCKGSFESDKDARLLLLVVHDKEYRGAPKNAPDGFLVPFYNEKSQIFPLTFTKAGIWYTSYSRSFLDTESDFEKAVTLYEKSFAEDAGLKNLYYPQWLSAKMQTESKADWATEEVYLKKTEAENLKNPVVLSSCAGAYRIMRKQDEYERIGNFIVKNFPTADFSLMRIAEDSLRAKTNLDEQFAHLDYLKTQKNAEKYTVRAWQTLLISYYQKSDWANIEKILTKAEPQSDLAELSGNIADRCIDKKLGKEAEICLRYIEKCQTFFADNKNFSPKITPKKADFIRKSIDEKMQKTAVGVNYLKKDFAAAMKYLPAVFEKSEGTNPNINEAYTVSLYNTGNKEKAKETGENAVRNAASTAEIKNTLKAIFAEKNPDAAAFQSYFAPLEEKAMAGIKSEISKKLINENAPNFKLKNLKGEDVELAALKGKVVILDFWATWCGPCIASFPAMQTAMKELENDKNVAFLFVNCWENVEDKHTHVKNFLEKRNLDFNVIFDLDAAVSKSYGVTGIPAKFFIDTEGKLRYKASGFSGNLEATVAEIKVLCDLLKVKK